MCGIYLIIIIIFSKFLLWLQLNLELPVNVNILNGLTHAWHEEGPAHNGIYPHDGACRLGLVCGKSGIEEAL